MQSLFAAGSCKKGLLQPFLEKLVEYVPDVDSEVPFSDSGIC